MQTSTSGLVAIGRDLRLRDKEIEPCHRIEKNHINITNIPRAYQRWKIKRGQGCKNKTFCLKFNFPASVFFGAANIFIFPEKEGCKVDQKFAKFRFQV